MKVSREQMAANRERILNVAAALFRERGFDNVSVADIMQQAGLTHGGFYGHFSSKEALAAESTSLALTQTAAYWKQMLEEKGDTALAELVSFYLSAMHRDAPGAGCVIASLGCDLARQPQAMRAGFVQQVEGQVEVIARLMPGASPAEKQDRAIALLAQLVGALVLARAIGNGADSDAILEAVKRDVARSLSGGT